MFDFIQLLQTFNSFNYSSQEHHFRALCKQSLNACFDMPMPLVKFWPCQKFVVIFLHVTLLLWHLSNEEPKVVFPFFTSWGTRLFSVDMMPQRLSIELILYYESKTF